MLQLAICVCESADPPGYSSTPAQGYRTAHSARQKFPSFSVNYFCPYYQCFSTLLSSQIEPTMAEDVHTTMPPAHPLLRAAQEALEKQLLESKCLLEEELREKQKALKVGDRVVFDGRLSSL